jgi:microcystin-dependent protein
MDYTLATVWLFAGNFEMRGWAYCDGRLMSIAENSAVFALIGTIYGGDGRTTFALPDLRGRVPVGAGSGPGRSSFDEGQAGGSEQTTILLGQLASHNHAVNVPTTDGAATSDDPNGNILALQGASFYAASNTATGSYGGVTDSMVGGNQPIKITSPYLALNYLFCLEGIFPSRN